MLSRVLSLSVRRVLKPHPHSLRQCGMQFPPCTADWSVLSRVLGLTVCPCLGFCVLCRHLHHLNYLWDHRVELTQPRTQHITQPHDTDNNPDTAGVPDSVREAVEPPGQQSGAHTGAPEAVQASMAAAQKVR